MDAREVHERDQRDAAARELARDLRVFWQALRAEGFPPAIAARLTESFLEASLQDAVLFDDSDEGENV